MWHRLEYAYKIHHNYKGEKMIMGKVFHHLSYDNRLLLKKMLDSGQPVKDIAKILSVSVSTIYRELKRSEKTHQYNPMSAQQVYLKKTKNKGSQPKLELDKSLAQYISKLIIEESLSPTKIIERLKREDYRNIPSKNTIYTAIDKGLIPSVSRETLLLKRKKTHMFSNGLIKIPKWICNELNLQDNEDLDINIANGKIIIKKSKK